MTFSKTFTGETKLCHYTWMSFSLVPSSFTDTSVLVASDGLSEDDIMSLRYCWSTASMAALKSLSPTPWKETHANVTKINSLV